MHPLASKIQMGDVRALARAISYIENNHEDKIQLLKSLHHETKYAHYIGVTGPPGAGKSSLVNELITFLRNMNLKVGVIAVDPTSPFSGGALLGDRVRMSRHFTDPNVFIRSMGTRGSLGGLSRSTKEAVRIMDAFKFDVILIETVGVGQSELDIMKIADTTMVILTPGSGDAVQVFKAGIMEIADLFVINKADLPGVPKLIAEIKSLLELVKHEATYKPPIVKTVSIRGEGMDGLWKALKNHQEFLTESGEGAIRRKKVMVDETLEFIEFEVTKRIRENLASDSKDLLDDVASGKLDPYSAAEQILTKWLERVHGKEG